MPSIKHIVELDYKPTFRSQQVAGMFDIPPTQKLRKEWIVNLPIEQKDWKVGLIVGASGSGKTTLANQFFQNKVHSSFEWKNNCLLDDFPEKASIKSITETLSKVGFSSPPAWLLPYSALSNGQKFRVELARCLFEYDDLFVFDEFTSVVDRQVAQVGAYAFSKAIKASNKKFVAVSCHYDIEEWLEPDWVYDVSSNQFKWGSLRRPEIEIKIFRVHHSAWELFKEHHYLGANINKAAFCFVGTVNDRPVVFDAWIPFFGKLKGNKKGMRSHRSVVLPDFQGLGISNRVFTTLTRMWAALGYRVFSKTAHPAEIKKRRESTEWKITNFGRSPKDTRANFKHATDRLTLSSEFVGIPMNIEEARKLYAG